MFKTKYKVWVALIILSVIIKLGISYIPGIFAEITKGTPEVNVYVQSTENSKLKNQLVGLSGNKISIKFVNSINDATQAILTDSSDLTIPTGFNKYENIINSPIVLFAPNTALRASENFTSAGGKSLTKDLYDILTAIESNKTWVDIGISKKVAYGTVSLIIPSKSSPYYNVVLETIYMALNQGKTTLTASDVIALEDRVNNILSKCTQVEDIGRYIVNKRDNSKEIPVGLVLGPEFIIVDKTSAFSSSDGDWMPIYLNKTSSVSMDLYVKPEFEKNIIKSFADSSFSSDTGMRMEERDYKLSDILSGFSSAIESVEVGQVDKSAKDKIKENIFKPTPIPTVIPSPIPTTTAVPTEPPVPTTTSTSESLSQKESTTTPLAQRDVVIPSDVDKISSEAVETDKIESKNSEKTEKETEKSSSNDEKKNSETESQNADEEKIDVDEDISVGTIFLIIVAVALIVFLIGGFIAALIDF